MSLDGSVTQEIPSCSEPLGGSALPRMGLTSQASGWVLVLGSCRTPRCACASCSAPLPHPASLKMSFCLKMVLGRCIASLAGRVQNLGRGGMEETQALSAYGGKRYQRKLQTLIFSLALGET